jgi:aryl-alcohol dehydrogenase-like predicted oxidoreductase
LHNPAVTGAIVGARNARQAGGVIEAGDLQLRAAETEEIENVSRDIAA